MSWHKVGTPGYWAPEVRKLPTNGTKAVKPSSDIFSLGIVILEIVLGEQDPFFNGSTAEEINKAMATKPIPYDELRKIDFNLEDLMRRVRTFYRHCRTRLILTYVSRC